MTAPQLAETTFVSGPDDGLAVVDVYGEGGSGVVNSYQETHPQEIDPLSAADGGNGDDQSGGGGDSEGGEDRLEDITPVDYGDDSSPNNDLSDLTGGLDGAPDVGTSLEAARLASGDEELVSDIQGLDDDMRGAICMQPSFMDNVVHQVGDVVTNVSSAVNFNSLQNLNNMVSRLAGGGVGSFGNIRDLGGLSSLVSTATQVASRAGIPNVFTQIVAGGRFNKNILTAAVTNMIPGIVRNANIPLLGEIARSPLGNILASVSPGIIGNTIRSIARPTRMTQSQYGPYYGEVRDTFSRVDPSWNKTNFGGYPGALNARVVSQNPFLQETLRANVSTRPLQVVPTSTGYVNQSDVYHEDRVTYVPETGGKVWDDEGVLVDTSASDDYARRTEYRKEDALMSAATVFPERTVDDYLSSTFPGVDADVNRTVDY